MLLGVEGNEAPNEPLNSMITITKRDNPLNFAAVRFVARAVTTDENRATLQNIYFEEGHVIGTDGRRLHRANTNPGPMGEFTFEEGTLYRIVKKTAHSITIERCAAQGRFPPYKQVIPSSDSNDLIGGFDLPKRDSALTPSGLFCKILNTAIRRRPDWEPIGFNIDYFIDAIPLSSRPYVDVYISGSHSPLYMRTADGFESVLMPVRCST